MICKYSQLGVALGIKLLKAGGRGKSYSKQDRHFQLPVFLRVLGWELTSWRIFRGYNRLYFCAWFWLSLSKSQVQELTSCLLSEGVVPQRLLGLSLLFWVEVTCHSCYFSYNFSIVGLLSLLALPFPTKQVIYLVSPYTWERPNF